MGGFGSGGAARAASPDYLCEEEISREPPGTLRPLPRFYYSCTPDSTLNLGIGEREAVALARQLQADLVPLDDRKARRAAQGRGLAVAVTLGVLATAAARGLVDLPTTINHLRQTTFRARAGLIQSLLEQGRERKGRAQGD